MYITLSMTEKLIFILWMINLTISNFWNPIVNFLEVSDIFKVLGFFLPPRVKINATFYRNVAENI